MRQNEAKKALNKEVRITIKNSMLVYTGVLKDVQKEVVVLKNNYGGNTAIVLDDIVAIEERGNAKT